MLNRVKGHGAMYDRSNGVEMAYGTDLVFFENEYYFTDQKIKSFDMSDAEIDGAMYKIPSRELGSANQFVDMSSKDYVDEETAAKPFHPSQSRRDT